MDRPCTFDKPQRPQVDSYRLVVTRGGTDLVRLEPFGALELELELEALWPTPVAEPKERFPVGAAPVLTTGGHRC